MDFILLAKNFHLMQKRSLLLLLLMLLGCAKKEPTAVVQFVVHAERTQLRAAPGENGKVLEELVKGAILYDEGEVSDFTTLVTLHGIPYNEPWLKVRTNDGITGWVYGGALNFDSEHPTALTDMLMEKRLQSMFGLELATQIESYRALWTKVQTEQDFAHAFRVGTKLRDTLTRVMEDRLSIQNPQELPDLFWLQQAVPGFVPQLVAEGTAYFLFWNFKSLAERAAKTDGVADNQFIDLNLHIFPEDSIEYFFPAWVIQTWDYGGSSLLGRGIHASSLEKMDKALSNSTLFQAEILRMKTHLINDMSDSDVTYWETKDKIVEELDAIIQSNFAILTNTDKIALTTRRLQFDEPEKHGIQLNIQAGENE